ncbi:MAG: Pyridoxal-5-phosphate-dependent protein beta subunit [Chloroflexi bacterium]|jgi:cysteine synthase A|nr:Pyridoxal-5-phosphate-dependent protein beta subunit [Chloroflexota bacterium]
MYRPWTSEAIRKIESDFHRSADTHLVRLDFPVFPDIQLYLKDESTHPTGSLKHRLARSLFLFGLCNGWINQDTTIIEASSGSTAISEAYFARMLGLPFIAVMPRSTSSAKICQIETYGGQCHFVDNSSQVYTEAQQLAKLHNGHYMDQFTFAERATDWRGNNNIAETIYQQMQAETYPVPSWLVVGAGTGGTSATLGRYIRYRNFNSYLCVVDPENSVFYDYYHQRDLSLTGKTGSAIEGIGRPRVEPSFMPDVVDRMIRVPDAASFAAMRFLEKISGRKYGASSGTNLYGTFQLAADMHRAGQKGSIVTLACDAGERYSDTYYNKAWLSAKGYNIQPYLDQLQRFYDTGQWES